LETAGGTGTFAWHTLHSTSPFISAAAAAKGSPKHRGSNQLRQNGRKIRGRSAKKSRENQERTWTNQENVGNWEP
jgi:hypothetical protein